MKRFSIRLIGISDSRQKREAEIVQYAVLVSVLQRDRTNRRRIYCGNEQRKYKSKVESGSHEGRARTYHSP